MHAADVVHRDIKAMNVFLLTKSLDDPVAKLGDFGGARFLNREKRAESKLIDGADTPVVGTPGFRAPEMQEESLYGPAVDIYALGVFFFETLGGSAHGDHLLVNDGEGAVGEGNGGSAAISSHFSVDLTKNAGLRCVNFNEADLITCFANDYGFERWVEKAVDFYGDEGDLLIVISSSGSSENMLNGVKAARKGKFKGIVTLSGFAEDNPLRQLGDINLWINSRAYNFVENTHQVWLLAIVDLIIGSREYSA